MVVVTDSANFNQRTRVKRTSIVLFFMVHITVITRPIHLLSGGLKNNCPLATVEAASRRSPPTSFPTPHGICKPCVAIRFVLLYGSSVIIKEVCISTVKPNIAGFDQLETTFELRNISQNQWGLQWKPQTTAVVIARAPTGYPYCFTLSIVFFMWTARHAETRGLKNAPLFPWLDMYCEEEFEWGPRKKHTISSSGFR